MNALRGLAAVVSFIRRVPARLVWALVYLMLIPAFATFYDELGAA